MPFAASSADVWFEGANQASVCVSVTENVSTVRILCNDFELDNVAWPHAADVVTAVLTDAVSFRLSGWRGRTLVLTARAGGEAYTAATRRPNGLSEWELAHLETR
jgi:hypothetical protein